MYRPSRLDLPKSGTIEFAFVRSSTATCFKFFDLSFEYFVGVQSPKPLDTKVLYLILADAHCASRPLFLQTGLQNMLEIYILCFKGGELARRLVQLFFGYFHQI
jgi:hypothetical protein